MKQTAVLFGPSQAHATLNAIWASIKPELADGKRLVVEVKPETRSIEQNRRLWALLTDVSEQVEWYGKRLSPEDWKHVFTSSLRKLEVVPNLDGTGFVALGLSTSRMSKRELSDLLELIYAFGAERGVTFHDDEPRKRTAKDMADENGEIREGVAA